jgi:8-oxo-dGTP pyrophosphatase MutT (NUDIX family)
MAASPPRPTGALLAPATLAERLAACLPQAPPERPADASPGMRAAVLVPLVARRQPVLLFTRRTESLARHSGQVSFPGGRAEPGDLSPLQTALREAAEETGLVPDAVMPAGYLSPCRTGTGFDIQPVVGVLGPELALTPDPVEVAAIFEAPLAFFRDPANGRRMRRNGGVHPVFTWEGHEIWGATARILVDLATRLGAISL